MADHAHAFCPMAQTFADDAKHSGFTRMWTESLPVCDDFYNRESPGSQFSVTSRLRFHVQMHRKIPVLCQTVSVPWRMMANTLWGARCKAKRRRFEVFSNPQIEVAREAVCHVACGRWSNIEFWQFLAAELRKFCLIGQWQEDPGVSIHGNICPCWRI